MVVTGAAGFIGSYLGSFLNKKGNKDLILVDDFSDSEKNKNLQTLEYHQKIDRNDFVKWLNTNHKKVDFIFHIGARTDTTEFNQLIFDELNLNYTKALWEICSTKEIPLIYASSAATYGLGEHGYVDSHEIVSELAPLNPYGKSKNDFDLWALRQKQTPPFWAGLKFFNVYGPNEFHKGRMASVIWHAFNQIKNTNKVKLFRSHNKDYKNGEQIRDFVYVRDVAEIAHFLYSKKPENGLFNVGTGTARTFNALAKATFSALNIAPNIEYIDTPIDIRDKYQYFTEANMGKLINVGYSLPFTTLEDGVKDYVQNYLSPEIYY